MNRGVRGRLIDHCKYLVRKNQIKGFEANEIYENTKNLVFEETKRYDSTIEMPAGTSDDDSDTEHKKPSSSSDSNSDSDSDSSGESTRESAGESNKEVGNQDVGSQEQE